MIRPQVLISTAFVLPLLLLAGAGCGSLYHLPDPPPRDSWARHSLSPTHDGVRSRERFDQARAAVFAFLDALANEDWDAAYGHLSNETRILLDDLSPDGRGETVLATGAITRDGADYQLEPLDLFVIRGLVRIEDEWSNESEAETYRRKELWAIGEEDEAHRVILIFESDAWRIHHPSIDLTPGSPGRRAAGS